MKEQKQLLKEIYDKILLLDEDSLSKITKESLDYDLDINEFFLEHINEMVNFRDWINSYNLEEFLS